MINMDLLAIIVLAGFVNGLIFLFVEKVNDFIFKRKFKWLRLVKTRNAYEYVERKNNKRGSVVIIAFDELKKIKLILSKRPTFDKPILEFPAGLIDNDDKSIEEAALRELSEETGCSGEVLKVWSPSPGAAGISNELLNYVIVEVGEEDNGLINHGNEKITILPFMSIDEIRDYIKKNEDEILVSNRVQSFLIGNEMKA